MAKLTIVPKQHIARIFFSFLKSRGLISSSGRFQACEMLAGSILADAPIPEKLEPVDMALPREVREVCEPAAEGVCEGLVCRDASLLLPEASLLLLPLARDEREVAWD